MKFLLLDCHNLCYRAYHSTGKTLDMGTVFGFLREIQSLKSEYRDSQFIFCWDHGVPKRLELLPTYKCSRETKRREYSDEEKASYLNFQHEVDLLKYEILWDLGYKNIRWQDGYEADDLCAEFLQRMSGYDTAVMVSSDQDLYQLLQGKRITQLKPIGRVVYTEKNLLKDYGVAPSQWHLVKALSGCSSDDVPGVHRVGGITAIKFLKGQLNPSKGMYKRIMENEALWLANQRLVKLPLPGVKPWKLREDDASKARWRTVVKSLSLDSLLEVLW